MDKHGKRRVVLALSLCAALAQTGWAQPQEKAAVNHYYKAQAEAGSSYAQLAWGEMLMAGEEVPRDYVQAYAWLHIALVQGVEEAAEPLKTVAQKLAPNEKIQAEAMAKELERIFLSQ